MPLHTFHSTAKPTPRPLLHAACRTPARPDRGHACASLLSASFGSPVPPAPAQVVVTRERGKNEKLKLALLSHGISTLELPLIETAPGPQRDLLPQLLAGGGFAWVAVTSPEAAAVFLEGWAAAGEPQVRVATVGAGTTRVLREAKAHERGIELAFQPSVANAEHLSAELPLEDALRGTRVLYPASAKAGGTLQEGLEERGFSVERISTYDTVPVETVKREELGVALRAQVIAVASPSAIKAWRRLTEGLDTSKQAIACIGSTSAKAAHALGYRKVFFPPNPGLDGFVEAIQDAIVQDLVRQGL